MNWTTNMDNKIREIELRHNPVMIRVNKFTEESANEFAQKMAKAHNTGQSNRFIWRSSILFNEYDFCNQCIRNTCGHYRRR